MRGHPPETAVMRLESADQSASFNYANGAVTVEISRPMLGWLVRHPARQADKRVVTRRHSPRCKSVASFRCTGIMFSIAVRRLRNEPPALNRTRR
jgi:hypothetical protein